MDGEELLQSLRRVADEKVGAVWSEAEAAARESDAEICAELEGHGSTCQRLAAEDAETRRKDILAAAEREALKMRHGAEQDLSDRLYPLALACSRDLRHTDGREAFAAFAREMPPLPWRRIRVNPADAAYARETFPDAEVVSDEGVSGGLEAETDGGRIRIVNTFEKRIENAWEELLPELMAKCYGKIQSGKTAAGDH